MELAKIDIVISVDMNGATSNVKIVSDAFTIRRKCLNIFMKANSSQTIYTPQHTYTIMDDGEDDFQKCIDDLNILNNAF